MKVYWDHKKEYRKAECKNHKKKSNFQRDLTVDERTVLAPQ